MQENVECPLFHARPQSNREACGSYVRLNRLSLPLLQIFRSPLTEVPEREITDPVGASRTLWRSRLDYGSMGEIV
jgi:hypothetical protein